MYTVNTVFTDENNLKFRRILFWHSTRCMTPPLEMHWLSPAMGHVPSRTTNSNHLILTFQFVHISVDKHNSWQACLTQLSPLSFTHMIATKNMHVELIFGTLDK